jgi:hypothetical protein
MVTNGIGCLLMDSANGVAMPIFADLPQLPAGYSVKKFGSATSYLK